MSGIGKVGGSNPLTTPLDSSPQQVAGGASPVAGTPPSLPTTPIGNVIAPIVTAPQINSSPLDRPKITIPENLTSASVSALIAMIQDEIQKTTDILASIQKIQIQEDSNKQQAANKDQIDKLSSAADMIEEAAKEAEAMKDVQWAMMAFSIFLTVCTAGGLGPFIGPIMVGCTVLSQVPIEGQNLTGWITTGVGEGLGEFEKAIYEGTLAASKSANGENYATDEEIEANKKEIDDSKNIQATALMIYFEVVIAVLITVATLGSGGGTAIGGAAEGITQESVGEGINIAKQVAQEAIQEVSQEATHIVQETVNEAVTMATNQAKNLQRLQRAVDIGTTVVQTGGSLAQEGMAIHTSYLEMENANNQADADKIKAYTKFLEKMITQEEEFLKELIESQAHIADTVKGILQTEHATNMHIANLTTHA